MGWSFWRKKEPPISQILNLLNEKRPLPLGRQEFEDWSDRIISGACLNGATPESIKWTLANDLMHLDPNVDFECDGYFIKRLRKFAVNQVADDVRREIYSKRKAQEDAEKATGEVLPKPSETNGDKVLATT